MLSGLKELFSGNETLSLADLSSIFSLLDSQWASRVSFTDFRCTDFQWKENSVPPDREVGIFIQSKDRPLLLFLYPPGMDAKQPFSSLQGFLGENTN